MGMGMESHLVKRLQMPVHPQTRDTPFSAPNPHLPEYDWLQGNIRKTANSLFRHRTIIMSFLCYIKRFLPYF